MGLWRFYSGVRGHTSSRLWQHLLSLFFFFSFTPTMSILDFDGTRYYKICLQRIQSDYELFFIVKELSNNIVGKTCKGKLFNFLRQKLKSLVES